MKKCAKCGRDNLDDMLFCGYCSERFPAEKKPAFTANRTLLTFYLLPEEVAVREVEKPKPVSDSDFTIEKNGDDYVLTKYNGAGGDVVIPDSVTRIGDFAFARCESLTSVTIPDSVTSIGDWAFDACKSLTSITIPDSVTSIGDNAFAWCESLTSITILDSVTSIGYGAFALCKSLTAINADINNPNYCSIDGVLYDKNQTMLIACPGGKESVTIPNSVTSIGNCAFADCTSLTSITIPDSVTSIGDYAFALCKSLTSITIPDSVTNIGDYAFALCKSLTSITIPDSVTSIGYGAFGWCKSLKSVSLPGSAVVDRTAFSDCPSALVITRR